MIRREVQAGDRNIGTIRISILFKAMRLEVTRKVNIDEKIRGLSPGAFSRSRGQGNEEEPAKIE